MKFNLKYLIIWYLVFYFLIEGGLHEFIIQGNFDNWDFEATAFSFTSILSFFLYWLLSYWVFYKFYPKKKWLHIILGLILSFFIPIVFRYVLEQKICLALFGYTNYPIDVNLKHYLIDNYIFATKFIPFGIIYYFFKSSVFNQKKEQALVIENQQMELSLLRSQINPHFLLNSLNNIQSLVYLKSDKTTDAIENLSDLLKYNLYQNKKWIPLSEEMNMIDKYLELEKLRHDYPLAIEFDIEDKMLNQNIPQHLIMPLIENAIKHADLKDPSQAFALSIKSQNKDMIITAKNRYKEKSKDSVGGIGLENLKKRLEIMYGNDHSFDVSKEDGSFALYIKIPIQ